MRRRLVSAATLLAYVASALGFPVPAALASPESACGQRVCCCGTSEQCRASGCGCAHQEAPAAEPDADDAPSCCAKKNSDAEPASATEKERPSSEASVRWVIGIAAHKCSGGPTDWLAADAALPASFPTSWQPDMSYCHSLHHIPPSTRIFVEDLPEPPPRFQAA